MHLGECISQAACSSIEMAPSIDGTRPFCFVRRQDGARMTVDASRIGRLVLILSGVSAGKRGAIVFSKGDHLRVRISPPTDADVIRTVDVSISEIKFID